MYATGYNTTDRPIVADDDGHIIAGGEFGSYDTTNDSVKVALATGALAPVERVSDDADVRSDARAAVRRTDELNKRVDALRGVDKDQLLELAQSADAPVDETPTKADLVDTLAHTSVPVPEKAKAPASKKSAKDKE